MGWTGPVPSAGAQGVPAPLVAVYDFLNSLDERSFGDHRPADELADPAALGRWLVGHGLARTPDCGSREHALALRLRAALRESAAGSAGEPPHSVWEAPDELALRAGRDAGGRLTLRAAGDGVPGALAGLLAAAVTAAADGSWSRVKTCAAPDCRWIFYDGAKPRNGRWCSTEGCGNRWKTRSYRRRHRSEG